MCAEQFMLDSVMNVHRDNGEQVSRSWNAVFSALSREPRRQLVVSLLDADPDDSVPLPESAMMPNVPVDPQTLSIELQHHHLPMLAEEGFITWETEPLRASRGPEFEEVAVIFDALHAEATALPETLVIGCRRLEEEREQASE